MMDLTGIRDSLPEFGASKKVCALCLAPAEKSCSDCRGVYYCSIEHQKSHWKDHEKDCPPILSVIANSPELGPHFVATRDLPPWTLLLTELPVLVNPLVILNDDNSSCISCRSILPSDPWTCHRCSTPFFCNLSCSMNKVHSEFECRILSKCSQEQRNKLCLKENLGCIRVLHLKNSDPETWRKVLKLRGANQYKPENVSENLNWFIREILPLLGEKGSEFKRDMTKLQGIIQQRVIVLRSEDSPDEDHEMTLGSFLLYLEASKLTQNCFPNCTRIIGKGPEFKLEIRTTVGLKKGDIPSIDYMGVSSGFGAIARQHIMNDIGGALCICPRCTDPTGTELGTMLSAVKCTQPDCEEGYLLPVDPMNMANDAPWRCNRVLDTGCEGKGSTWTEIEEITSRAYGNIAAFQVPIEDDVQVKEFWDNLKKSLHPNHYIVIGFERKLVYELNSQMMDQEMEFSLSRLNLHIAMIEHLLQMAEVIDPGLSRPRGILLDFLFNGLKNRVLKEPDFMKRAAGRRRTARVIEKLLPIAKCYPDIWTPSEIQSLVEG